jgi:WD40 repeat protein
MENQIGKVIKSYEIEGLVGTGGFGAVYRARQAVVAREVAIKVIWPAFANHPNFIRRFEAEAQLVAGLEHPHIVPLYDYWREPDGAYIVMRFLKGGALRNRMEEEQGWDVRDVNRVLENVSNALALAHRYGIVHRDIKPENILLDEDGNAYLADFGIAQIVSTTKDDDEFGGMGSPGYASPEQINGGLISLQSDIYSLGLVAWELLAGHHPFPELAEMSMTQVVEVRTTSPLPNLHEFRPDLPLAVSEVLAKATSLDPRGRYPDALTFSYEFSSSIESLLRGGQKAIRVVSTDVIPNPYKGLRAFQESDATLFFGREALIKRLLNRLHDGEEYHRFLAVVGPSGSGKSSVVRAGLIPALRQGGLPSSVDWYYADVIPGAQPFQELANVLTSLAVTPPTDIVKRLETDPNALRELLDEVLPEPSDELFLFIDQFEEIFTLAPSENQSNHFIELLYYALTAPNSRLRLVITIRADFYDRPLLQPRISNLMRERTEVVVPMSPSELERVIIEPARKVGVGIDNGLVAAIVAEVKEQPGALPLLQYALSELFERRDGAFILPEAYRDLGGVRGALAKRADEIYDKFDKAHKEAMRQLFLRLVTLGEGTEDTRRRALLSEVTTVGTDKSKDSLAVMQSVVETLGRARLLAFDRDPITRSPTVEVTHEAIIREWGKLREWLDESRNDVRLQRALATLASEWEAANRDASFLLRKGRLEQYERWQKVTTLTLSEQEAGFLNASLEEKIRQEKEEQERQAREKELEQRSFRALRLLVGVLLVAIVGALGLTTFALRESARAEENARVAREQAQVSRSIAYEASARNALSEDNSDLALALALLANEAVPNPPIVSRSTLSLVALSRGTRKVLPGHDAAVLSVAINADSTRIASSSADAVVKIWDAQSGDILYRMVGHGGDVESVAFSPDGRYVVSSAADFLAIIWDVSTGQEVRRLRGHSAPVRRALFTPDGAHIITASSDSTLIKWRVDDGTPVTTFTGHTSAALALAIAPDGKTALSGARDGRLIQWDLETGAVLREFTSHRTAVSDIGIDLTGTRAVTVSVDGTMILWDLTAGVEALRFVGVPVEVRSVAFTPDGNTVLSASLDGAVQLWSTRNGLSVDRLLGHGAGVLSVAVNAMGNIAISGSQDQTIRIWQIGNTGQLATLNAHSQRVSEMVVGARTGSIYSGSPDGVLQIYASTGRRIRTFNFTDMPILALAVSPDETRALIGSRAGKLFELELGTGAVIRELVGHSGNVLGVDYDASGTRAVTTSQQGEVFVWQLSDGTRLGTLNAGDKPVYSALFVDDAHVVSTSGDDSLRLWNYATGAELRRYEGHRGTVYTLDVTADGKLLASGARDGLVIVWNIETGQEQARLNLGVDTVWGVNFTRDGERLLVGTSSGQVLLWDVLEGDILQRFTGGNTAFSVAIGNDGARAFSGQDDGTIVVWQTFRFDGTDVVEWARENRYVRPLTRSECEQFRVESAQCES